jgi:hypothetical protein
MSNKTDRDDTTDQLAQHPAVRDLAKKRIGLVLGGGGAKGAYQAGCLQALQSLGIRRFHVVSGTSVGALNGAGAAAFKIHEMGGLWEEISFSKVLGLSPRVVFYLVFEIIAQLLISLSRDPGIWMISLFLAGGALAILFWDINWAIFIWIALSVYTAMHLSKIAWFLAGGGQLLKRVTRKYFSIAHNAPLRRTLQTVLYNDGEKLDLHCPTFVTIARDGFWFDPDDPSFVVKPGLGRALEFHYDVQSPLFAHGWLPAYCDITTVPKDALLDLLLESAALPFAFRVKNVEGLAHLDGGIVENVPLNKALEFDCDLIIVIYLSSDKENPQKTLDQVPRLRRALSLAASDQHQLHKLYLNSVSDSNPDRWRYFHPGGLPVNMGAPLYPVKPLETLPPFIHLIPSENLGGLLRGTLNFRARKARRLMSLGRMDTVSAIKSYVACSDGRE